MKNSSLYHTEMEMNSDAHKKIYAAEELTMNVTEDILIQMEDMEVTKADLADRLGKTRAYVSQLLSGSRNMTLRTLSDICYVLNVKLSVSLEDVARTSIASKQILNSNTTNWQDYINDSCVFTERMNHVNSTITKENVIVRNEREFWRRAA